MAISKSALIVSSNDATVQQMKPLLQELGFEQFFTSSHSADALELAYAEKPDIVFINSHIDGRLGTKELSDAVGKVGLPFILLLDEDSTTQQHNYITLSSKTELEAVQKAVDTVISKAEEQPRAQKNTFFIRTNNRFYRVKAASIRWIESDGNYSVIHCMDKKFILKMSLRKVLQELASYDFIQIHKRYIVNASEIEYIDVSENKVFLSDREIPIGRRYKDELLGRLKCLK